MLQDKTGAVLPLNQDENVQHSTDSGERIYCLQIKKIILLCLTWIGMRQPHPFLPLSLLLAPSVTYSEECSTALYSANAELQLFLTVELRFYTHTHRKIFTLHGCWNMAFVRFQVANFIIFFKKRNTKKGDILNYVVDLIHIPQVYVTSPLLLHTWNNSFSARSPLWLGACNIHLPTASLITFPCN